MISFTLFFTLSFCFITQVIASDQTDIVDGLELASQGTCSSVHVDLGSGAADYQQRLVKLVSSTRQRLLPENFNGPSNVTVRMMSSNNLCPLLDQGRPLDQAYAVVSSDDEFNKRECALEAVNRFLAPLFGRVAERAVTKEEAMMDPLASPLDSAFVPSRQQQFLTSARQQIIRAIKSHPVPFPDMIIDFGVTEGVGRLARSRARERRGQHEPDFSVYFVGKQTADGVSTVSRHISGSVDGQMKRSDTSNHGAHCATMSSSSFTACTFTTYFYMGMLWHQLSCQKTTASAGCPSTYGWCGGYFSTTTMLPVLPKVGRCADACNGKCPSVPDYTIVALTPSDNVVAIMNGRTEDNIHFLFAPGTYTLSGQIRLRSGWKVKGPPGIQGYFDYGIRVPEPQAKIISSASGPLTFLIDSETDPTSISIEHIYFEDYVEDLPLITKSLIHVTNSAGLTLTFTRCVFDSTYRRGVRVDEAARVVFDTTTFWGGSAKYFCVTQLCESDPEVLAINRYKDPGDFWNSGAGCIRENFFSSLLTSENVGGPRIHACGSLEIREAQFWYLLSAAGGGGLDVESVTNVTLTRVFFDANIGFEGGGGRFVDIERLSISPPSSTNTVGQRNRACMGGAFFIDQVQNVEIAGIFITNQALKNGGAIFASNVDEKISLVENFNSKKREGGMGVVSGTYFNGAVSGDGGFLYAQDSGAVSVALESLKACWSQGNGGAIAVATSDSFVFELRSTVDVMQSFDKGGVLYLREVRNVTILPSDRMGVLDCQAAHGGFAYFEYCDHISFAAGSSTFLNTHADFEGGVLAVNGAQDFDFTAEDASILASQAAHGGFAFFEGCDHIRFDVGTSTFSRNQADYEGGLVAARDASSFEFTGMATIEWSKGDGLRDSSSDYVGSRGGGVFFLADSTNINIVFDFAEQNTALTGGFGFFDNVQNVFINSSQIRDSYAMGRDHEYFASSLEAVPNDSDVFSPIDGWGGSFFFVGSENITVNVGYTSSHGAIMGGFLAAIQVQGIVITGNGDDAVNFSNDLLQSGTISYNGAEVGGGLALIDCSDIRITGIHFSTLVASGGIKGDQDAVRGEGGAIYLRSCNSILIEDNKFNKNIASFGGAAIASIRNANISIVGSTFTGNVAVPVSAWGENIVYGGGGAILSVDETLIIEDCKFESNSARNGSAVYCTSACEIYNSAFLSNDAQECGTIFVSSRILIGDYVKFSRTISLNVFNSSFQGNTAELGGGAVCSWSAGSRLVGSQIAGVYVYDEALISIEECSFKLNRVSSNGGVINFEAGKGSSNLTVSGSTFDDNISIVGASSMSISGADHVSIRNTSFSRTILSDIEVREVYVFDTNAVKWSEVSVSGLQDALAQVANTASLSFSNLSFYKCQRPRPSSLLLIQTSNVTDFDLSEVLLRDSSNGLLDLDGTLNSCQLNQIEISGSHATSSLFKLSGSNATISIDGLTVGDSSTTDSFISINGIPSVHLLNSFVSHAAAVDTFISCEFAELALSQSNFSTVAAAGSVIRVGPQCSAVVDHTSFTNCSSTGDGTVIRVSDGSTAVFRNIDAVGGHSANRGGAVMVEQNGHFTAHHCRFERNTATVSGGSLASLKNSSMAFDDGTQFIDNEAPYGGSIWTSSCTRPSFRNTTIEAMEVAATKSSHVGLLVFVDTADGCEFQCNEWMHSGIQLRSKMTKIAPEVDFYIDSPAGSPSSLHLMDNCGSNILVDTSPFSLAVETASTHLPPGLEARNVVLRVINSLNAPSLLPNGECRISADTNSSYDLLTIPSVALLDDGVALFDSLVFSLLDEATVTDSAHFTAVCTVRAGIGNNEEIELSAPVEFAVDSCSKGETLRPSLLRSGTLVCGPCDDGAYPLCTNASSPLQNQCIGCPTGFDCVDGTMKLASGFWSSALLLAEHMVARCGSDVAAAQSPPVASLLCPKDTCNSNDPSFVQRSDGFGTDSLCSEGYHGPLCLACAPGFRPDRALGCVDCDVDTFANSGAFTVAIALCSSAVVLCMLICLERRKLLRGWRTGNMAAAQAGNGGSDEQVMQFLGVQVIDFVQTLTLILAMQQFDGSLLGSVGDGIRGFLVSFFSPILGCILNIDEIQKFYVKIGTFVAVVVLAPILWTIIASIKRCCGGHGKKKDDASAAAEDPDKMHPLAYEYLLVIMLLAFVFQPFIIDECLRVLTWVQLDSTQRVWFSDPTFDYCGFGSDTRHCTPFAVALAFIFLFGLVYLAIIWRLLVVSAQYLAGKRSIGDKQRRSTSTFVRWSASLLGQAVSSSVWWWPLSIVFRKYIIIAIKLLMRDRDMQFFLTALTLLGWKALASATHVNSYRAQVEAVSSYIHLLNVVVSFPMLGSDPETGGARLSEFLRNGTAAQDFQSAIDATLVVITLLWILILLVRWIVAAYRLSLPRSGVKLGALAACFCCTSVLTCGMCSCLCLLSNAMDRIFNRFRRTSLTTSKCATTPNDSDSDEYDDEETADDTAEKPVIQIDQIDQPTSKEEVPPPSPRRRRSRPHSPRPSKDSIEMDLLTVETGRSTPPSLSSDPSTTQKSPPVDGGRLESARRSSRRKKKTPLSSPRSQKNE